MKLHYHPLSTFARRLLIYIKERHLDMELIPVDMSHKEHKSEAYLKLNPYGRVPTLQDGSLTLYESAAILYYLEDKFPEHRLLPDTLEQRALCRMHIGLCDIEFAIPGTKVYLPKRFIPQKHWDMEKIRAAEQTIQRHLGILSGQLGKHSYLLGSDFSLADLAYMPFLEFLPLLDVKVPNNIERWRNALSERKSAISTRPDV